MKVVVVVVVDFVKVVVKVVVFIQIVVVKILVVKNVVKVVVVKIVVVVVKAVVIVKVVVVVRVVVEILYHHEPKACQPMRRRHRDDKREKIIDEGVEGFVHEYPAVHRQNIVNICDAHRTLHCTNAL